MTGQPDGMDPSSLSLPDSIAAILAPLLANPVMTLGFAVVFVGLALLFGPLTRRRRTPVAAPGAPPRFETRPVLNAAERRLHREIERLMPAHFHPQARLLSQVSLAEFLYAPLKSDHQTIFASRIDMLIVNGGFQPLCAIEYQGAGHHGTTPQTRARTRTRDYNKRRALRLAGVPLVEIPADYDSATLAALLGDVTGRRPPPPAKAAPRRPDLPARV